MVQGPADHADRRIMLVAGEVPKHLRVPYIETGYRPSAMCCPPSNETMNVWTHLLGMFWAIYML